MNWKKTINERIDSWIKLFDEDIRFKLNFSPNSLNIVEEILLKKYENIEHLNQDDDFEFVDNCLTYIGEIFRKNDNIRTLEWIVDEYNHKVFPTLECPFYKNSWVDNAHHLPYLLHVRTGKTLHDYFIKNTTYFLNNKKRLFRGVKPKPMPGMGGYSYQYFILVKDESFKLQEIEEELKSYYSKKGVENKVFFYNEEHLLVEMSDNYFFHFQLNTSEDVLQESEEISESYVGDKDKSLIASCKMRIEFWGDADEDADYVNEYMYILEQFMDNENLLIYDHRNGVFFDEM